MTDDVQSEEPCPKCGKKQWWFAGIINGKTVDTIAVASHCSACNTYFRREVEVTELTACGRIIKSDAVIIAEVIRAQPESVAISEMFRQRHWKALDPTIRRYEKTKRGYKYWIDNRRGEKGASGHNVLTELMVKIGLLLYRSKSSKKTAEVYEHCTSGKQSTINHTLRFMRHIGVIKQPRRGYHCWVGFEEKR